MFTSHPKHSSPSNNLPSINEDYIQFIKNNHNMIQKHFLNDFQHPYKQSLLKSHSIKPQKTLKINDNATFINNKKQNQTSKQLQINLLYTIQQTDPKKQSTQFKSHQSTSFQTQKISRKHQIANSLNFIRQSQGLSLTNNGLHSNRYLKQQKKNTTLSKNQILGLLQQKNRQISQQLLKQRNNFSDIVYKNKHHSQSNTFKSSDNKTSIQRLQHSQDAQRLHKIRETNNDAKTQRFQGQKKNQPYRYSGQYFSQPQIGGSTLDQKSIKDSNLLPSIKKRSNSFRQEAIQSDTKIKQKLHLNSQYDIIEQIHSRKLNQNVLISYNNNQNHKQAGNNNLSASINQLRKQFQQNSDAIKLYKKVQKNNAALKVRQINEKNLKSYYEYENSIIKNHIYLIEQEQRKNDVIMKQLKSSQKINKLVLDNKKDQQTLPSEHKISQQEMFLRQITGKTDEQIKQYLRQTISPKNKKHKQTTTQIEDQLVNPDNQQTQKNFNQNSDQQSQRSSTLSPSKIRKLQQKNVNQPIIVSTKADNTIYDLKMRSYRQFAFKINFTCRKFSPLIIKELTSTFMKNQQKFKFYVGKGNNSQLIKSLMKRRFWWMIEQDPKKANFVWTQLKINSLYEYQRKGQIKNLYYKSQDIQIQSSPDLKKLKKRKDLNLQLIKERKSPIFKAPLPEDEQMKVFTEYDKKMFNRLSSALNQMMNPDRLDNFERRIQYFPQGYLDKIQQCQKQEQTNDDQLIIQQNSIVRSTKVHNHFEFNHFIGNKKALFYNLRYYYNLIGKDVYDIVPLTFHIRNGVKDPQYNKFLKYYKGLQKKSAMKSSKGDNLEQPQGKKKKQKNIWIIKPGQNSNRGNGIQVFDQIYELNNILKKKDKDKNNQQHTYIVQKYIQKPLLYKNRKFDIRHYFVLTRMYGKMKAYFFGQGYIRTASYQFDLSNVGDTQIHLTNDAIQKYCDTYGKYQQSNKLSYVEFQRYLDSVAKEQSTKSYGKKNQNQKKSISFANQIYPQMRNIAIQAIKACYIQMDPNKTQHNFEVFGMDFMIDKDYKVWLIEINTNPCLQLSSKLLERVIPTMVEQSLRLTIDILFPPPYHYPNTMKHMMPDFSLDKFKYELIFDEDRDGKELDELFQKQIQKDRKQGKKSIREMLLGQIDEEDETYQNDGKQINVGQKGGVQVE